MSGTRAIKLLLRGDGASGKTCLLIRYTENKFPTEYVPTVFDNYEAKIKVDGVTVQLQLWDTAVREDGDRLVALSYPNTDVFFICFSVVSLNSLANCPRYIKQTRDVVPNAHMFLVGLKSDLREDTAVLEKLAAKNQHPVPVSDAEEMVRLHGLDGYLETSALTGDGVKEAFDTAIRACATDPPTPNLKKGGCILL